MFRLVRDQRLNMLEGKRLVGAVGIEFTVRSTSPVDSVALPPLACLKTAKDTPVLSPSCGQILLPDFTHRRVVFIYEVHGGFTEPPPFLLVCLPVLTRVHAEQ